MEENKLREENLTELMTKIEEAMNMTRDKQADIDEKQKALREETRIIVVEEGKVEIEDLKKAKAEFDEMTFNAFVNASREIKEIREESEKEYQDKLISTLERKKDIEEKLISMKKRDLTPEKLEMVEQTAKKALENASNEMEEFQNVHFERRKKLDDWEKQISSWALELGFEDKLTKQLVVIQNEKTAPTKPEPTEPVATKPTATESVAPVKLGERYNPLEDRDKVEMDEELLAKLAKASGINNLDDMRNKVINETKVYNEGEESIKLTPQQMLEDMAQDKGIIPYQIKRIDIYGDRYELVWGHGEWLNEDTKYKIGENGLDLDRKSEAKFKEFILAEFPESKKCINKLDVGIINVLYRNNRKDLCKSYIESVRTGKRQEDSVDIFYDISDARGFSREETVVSRNARKHKNIAEIEGKRKNIFRRTFDTVRNGLANFAVRVDRRLHPDRWNDEIKQLTDSMKLLLPDKKVVMKKEDKILKDNLKESSNIRDLVSKGNERKILEDLYERKRYPESEKDLKNHSKITMPETVQRQIKDATEKLKIDQEEVKDLSIRERMKVGVENRRIYKEIKNGKNDEEVEKTLEDSIEI